MSERTAVTCRRIFDGEAWHEDAALLIAERIHPKVIQERLWTSPIWVTPAAPATQARLSAPAPAP